MIDLYYWPTPNGWKISIMLEELGMPYDVKSVDIGKGEQFEPDFLKISPNNRMPAIVDHDGPEGPISIFESGAILCYLAEKTGRFLPAGVNARYEVLQWVFWQVGGLGPMAGQLSHFVNYAPEPNPYSHERYAKEYDRLLGVMDRQLADREYLVGDYSIADMASWPWLIPYKRFEQSLEHLPNVQRWHAQMRDRPAVR
ncbi:MAG: glutathione S-transferase N-terminal domain-containing protein, partial [Gammaproteobacteria bacterium]|nr:glutathione S-transferase N-terminal domain-containing protein [Gammaproteobacteria bacterium]